MAQHQSSAWHSHSGQVPQVTGEGAGARRNDIVARDLANFRHGVRRSETYLLPVRREMGTSGARIGVMDPMAESLLTELVRDPLVGLVMKSDGVDRRSIELLFERIGRGPGPGPRLEALRPRHAGQEINRCTTC